MDMFSYFSRVEPYSLLTQKEQKAVFGYFRPSVLPPEAVVFQQGQVVSEVGIIQSGKVNIVVVDDCGNENRCGCLGPGDLLFDVGVLTGGDATVSAICAEATMCLLQSRTSFMQALKSYLPLHLFFYQHISLQLHLKENEIAGNSDIQRNDSKAGSGEPLFIKRALEYIHENYRKPICLEMVANETAMSKFHFSRQFKLYMGMSFKQYLNRVRIKAAKKMMLSLGYNVTEASYAVGFNDASYFSRVFRDVEGVPPKQMLSYGRKKDVYHNLTHP